MPWGHTSPRSGPQSTLFSAHGPNGPRLEPFSLDGVPGCSALSGGRAVSSGKPKSTLKNSRDNNVRTINVKDMTLKKRTALLAVAVVLGVTASCGGDDSADDVASTVSTDAASPDSSDPDSGLPNFGYDGGTFITIFEDNDIFSTLLAAVNTAELTELLDGDTPFTFFAPANKAFDDLPAGVLDKLLLPENRETLLEILRYHLVEGSLRSTDLTNGDIVSVQGSPIAIEVFATDKFNELLKVNGQFSLLPNMEATNGTIHMINWIMVPPGIDLEAL